MIDPNELDQHCERVAETLRPLAKRAELEMLKARQERARPLDEVMLILGEPLPLRLNGGSEWL